MSTNPVRKFDLDHLVATNVRRIRTAQRCTVRALAAALAERGWPLVPGGITKIELGDRAVRVGELPILAAALGVPLLDLITEHPACVTCGGRPPEGFRCEECLVAGGPA